MIRRSRVNRSSKRFESTRNSRRRVYESFDGQDTFESSFADLQRVAQKLVKEYGEDVTDEMNVVFWAKDGDGTPCLVNGAYNYWSGDAELTITEIAEGSKPDGFIKALDKCFVDSVPYLNELATENVVDALNKEYGLRLGTGDLEGIDYETLYDNLIEDGEDIPDDKDDFVEFCQEKEMEDFDEAFAFGWEYSTVEQGNLFWGRTNSNFAKGCTFIVTVDLFGQTDDCSYAGETDVDEKGLRKLADAIANHTTERPRWDESRIRRMRRR